MQFANDIGNQAIQDVLGTYPEIGEILARYDIGCITCKVYLPAEGCGFDPRTIQGR